MCSQAVGNTALRECVYRELGIWYPSNMRPVRPELSVLGESPVQPERLCAALRPREYTLQERHDKPAGSADVVLGLQLNSKPNIAFGPAHSAISRDP
jgi:hypothetical protein